MHIPPLRFDNRTPLDALHFDTIDPHDQGFHVIVAKTGFTLGPADARGYAALLPAVAPTALVTEDEHHTKDTRRSSVRRESDLAPFKPRCDVLVDAVAHAPRGVAVPQFNVGLHVQMPDQPAPLPERPVGLSPLQGPSPAALQAWHRETQAARGRRIAGERLVGKGLTVTGECHFGPARANGKGQRFWELSAPTPFTRLPLRYEHAWGGESRIERDAPQAAQLADADRLTPAQQAGHPDRPAPAAHQASDTNPLGAGFMTHWYLASVGPNRVTAPRISESFAPVKVETFMRGVTEQVWPEPAGLGPIGRGWRPRRDLVGHIDTDRTWAADEVPRLPPDFDFGHWNCAPIDQQTRHLEGGERVALTNLCAPDHPSAIVDAQGQTQLRFTVPQQALFLVLTFDDGRVRTERLALDTLFIAPETREVEMVWRACLPTDGDMAGLVEARLHHADTPAQLARLGEVEHALQPDLPPAPPPAL